MEGGRYTLPHADFYHELVGMNYFRKIFSIAFPFANSSISLSR